MMQEFEDWMLLSSNAVSTSAKVRERVEYLVHYHDLDVEGFRRNPLRALAEGNRVLIERKRRGLPNALRNSRQALNLFAAFCGHQGIKWSNMGENTTSRPAVYRPAQIARSMALKVHENQPWLHLVLAAHEYNLATGLRRGEVARTTMQHIDFDEARYKVRHPTKAGIHRELPFADRRILHPDSYFMTWLEARPYCDQDRYAIWVHPEERRPLTADELGSRMTLLRRVVGFQTSFQRGRAFWAVELYKQGVREIAIQEGLGHRKLDTTRQYLRDIVSFLELEIDRVRPSLQLSVSDAVLPLGAVTPKTWQATLELEGLLATP